MEALFARFQENLEPRGERRRGKSRGPWYPLEDESSEIEARSIGSNPVHSLSEPRSCPSEIGASVPRLPDADAAVFLRERGGR
jgi:hypothetical protein